MPTSSQTAHPGPRPSAHAIVANSPSNDPDRLILERFIEIARQHGAESEPDHEVGDLQDLLRPMWGLLNSDQKRQFLTLPEVSQFAEGAGFEALMGMEDEVDSEEWEEVLEYYGLDHSFEYGRADVVDYVNRHRLATAVSLGSQGRYIHGTWGHFFGPGLPESMVRFVLDRNVNKLIALQIQQGATGRWADGNHAQLLDVQSSVLEANSEAVDSPVDYGLAAGDEVPDWARAGLQNQAKPPALYRVLLANRGNRDHGQDERAEIPGTPTDHWLDVASLQAASAACRAYLEQHGLGSGNWTGGDVKNGAGEVVAKVSYNGRVWSPDQKRDLLQPALPAATPRERGG
jgi:hypothetical protein